MGALLGLQLMPKNEGRGSQLWGGRGGKRERLEHVWRIRESRRETNVLSGKKKREEKLCFHIFSPHINSLPRCLIEEYCAKFTLKTKTHS